MARNINISDILKRSFQIVFKNPILIFVLLLPITLSLLTFLFALSILISDALIYSRYLILLSIFLIAFGFWLLIVGVGSLVLSIERIVKRRPVKILEIFDQTVRNSFRLSIAYLLEQLFIIGGLLLLIVPGIFLAARLALVTPSCILEKKGFGIKRSWNATKGNFWKIFLILLIWNVMFIVIGLLPYVSIINILLLPVYLTTLTLLYIQLRKR